MNKETTKDEVNSNQAATTEEDWSELIAAVRHNGLVALRMYYDDVEGQVVNIQPIGPVFVFHVKDELDSVYSCGFFLHELVAKFQSSNDPALWMSSYFVDLMETKGGKSLPQPATNEEEAKAIIDKILVPQCINAVNEEFAPEQVHAALAWKEEHGPVFEVGFPTIIEGNNVCAVPLHLLLIHLQMNRDPGELLIQGLYTIRDENGMN